MTIFEFSDYRAFLRSFISSLPKKGYGAINKIAAHLGVHSSLISQILSGKKDFSLEQAYHLCEFIGFDQLDTDYFLLLLERERAGTKALKNYFEVKIEKTKKDSLQIAKRIPRHRELTDFERSVFYSSWVYSAIRLWTSIGEGKTLDQISERFSLPRAKTAEILRFLADSHLCVEENGFYKMGPQRTHLESKSPFTTRLHSNWRVKSIQKADHLSEAELMFTAPLSISRKDFEKIREELMALIKSVSQRVTRSEPEEIACFNIDLFWID